MKTAVAYYSLGGTTRSYARAEAKARNADLIELTPKTLYNRFTAFVRGCLEAVKQKSRAKVRLQIKKRGCTLTAQRDIRASR